MVEQGHAFCCVLRHLSPVLTSMWECREDAGSLIPWDPPRAVPFTHRDGDRSLRPQRGASQAEEETKVSPVCCSLPKIEKLLFLSQCDLLSCHGFVGSNQQFLASWAVCFILEGQRKGREAEGKLLSRSPKNFLLRRDFARPEEASASQQN